MTEPIRNLLAKAIDDLDAGKEVDLIELERECKAADLAQAPAPVRDGMDVLSGLSSYLGAGLGDETTTAEDYDKRIRWGIDYNASATVRLCADVIERLSKDAYSGQPIQWGQIKSAVLAVSPALEAPDAGVPCPHPDVYDSGNCCGGRCFAPDAGVVAELVQARAELATLRDRLARMEGAIKAELATRKDYESGPHHKLDAQLKLASWQTASARLRAALTDGGSNG